MTAAATGGDVDVGGRDGCDAGDAGGAAECDSTEAVAGLDADGPSARLRDLAWWPAGHGN